MSTPVATGALERLAAEIAGEGGLLAAALRATPTGGAPHGDLVARGPRADGHAADLPLVVEAVREGYLLHYGASRLLDDGDPDLALLAGDRLYALGLERLAASGDLAAVRALADVIALSAQAHAGEDPQLADAVWQAGVAELGWGPSPALEAAKEAVRAGAPSGAQQLIAAAAAAGGELASER